MSNNNYGIARRWQPSAEPIRLDRESQHALVRTASNIRVAGDIARVAMEEMTTNYVTAEQLAAQGLTAAHCMANKVPQSEVAQAYLNTLTQHFVQRMVALTDMANASITQRTGMGHHHSHYYR